MLEKIKADGIMTTVRAVRAKLDQFVGRALQGGAVIPGCNNRGMR